MIHHQLLWWIRLEVSDSKGDPPIHHKASEITKNSTFFIKRDRRSSTGDRGLLPKEEEHYMSQIEHFDKLVQYARRDDGYINATEWCKHFEYRLDNWKQLPETKARLKRLKIAKSNTEPWIVQRVGKTWVTWVHPIMAVHLASYLSPGFANYIAETFIRYVAADPTLAADIALRQETTEGLDIINKVF